MPKCCSRAWSTSSFAVTSARSSTALPKRRLHGGVRERVLLHLFAGHAPVRIEAISGGMHEDLDITNNSMKPVRFQLEIVLRCDFADIFEVKSGSILRRGRITTEWSAEAATSDNLS